MRAKFTEEDYLLILLALDGGGITQCHKLLSFFTEDSTSYAKTHWEDELTKARLLRTKIHEMMYKRRY